MTPQVKPLSYRHRNLFFTLLATVFFLSLPFLFLYATGYRFNFNQTSLVSTGGLYVAVERTGAEIYINGELVRETRVFRRAFYSQGLEAATHRIHVQKEGHHTWVKELPVYPHLVTEAQAFNLPLTPQVRVISPWQTESGVMVLTSSSTVLTNATASNQYLFEHKASTSTLASNSEFSSLITLFETSATSTVTNRANTALNDLLPTATSQEATTTKEWRGVRLYEGEEGNVYATFVGSLSQMPYYYCADSFPPYQPSATTTKGVTAGISATDVALAANLDDKLPLEVQTVSIETPCDPTIQLDRKGEMVSYFDFFPNSTDLVLLAQASGVYAVEIDNRAWQNRQPILLGEDLRAVVQNGTIYIYDGQYIYQVLINQSWF
ncbi:MAG: PEGA domain-containing protein [Candidatus Paceibacterota bacterium]